MILRAQAFIVTTMTHTVAPIGAPPYLAAFMAMHRAMRRDLAILPAAVEIAVARGKVEALGRWFGFVRETIEHHHHIEDDALWPEIERRRPGFLSSASQLVADHHDLDEAIDRVEGALLRLIGSIDPETVESAMRAARDLGTTLGQHLDREERLVIGKIASAFTAEEYEQFEGEAARGTPFRLFAFGLPWLLDGVDAATRRDVLGPMPMLARLLLGPFGWWYRRIAAPVRDLASPTSPASG